MSRQLWFYIDADDNEQGPIKSRELHALAKDGTITKETQVWTEELKERWISAHKVTGLFPDDVVRPPARPPKRPPARNGSSSSSPSKPETTAAPEPDPTAVNDQIVETVSPAPQTQASQTPTPSPAPSPTPTAPLASAFNTAQGTTPASKFAAPPARNTTQAGAMSLTRSEPAPSVFASPTMAANPLATSPLATGPLSGPISGPIASGPIISSPSGAVVASQAATTVTPVIKTPAASSTPASTNSTPSTTRALNVGTPNTPAKPANPLLKSNQPPVGMGPQTQALNNAAAAPPQNPGGAITLGKLAATTAAKTTAANTSAAKTTAANTSAAKTTAVSTPANSTASVASTPRTGSLGNLGNAPATQGNNIYPATIAKSGSFGQWLMFNILGLLLIVGGLALIARDSLPDQPMVGIALMAVGALFMAIAGIMIYIFLYRAWKCLQPGGATVSPGAAVGLLFVPLFNIYWIFKAFGSLPKQWNTIISAYPNTKRAPRLSIGAFVCLLLLPLIGQVIWVAQITKGLSFMRGLYLQQSPPKRNAYGAMPSHGATSIHT